MYWEHTRLDYREYWSKQVLCKMVDSITFFIHFIGAYVNGDEKHIQGKDFTYVAENFAHAAEMILTAKKSHAF